MTDGAIEVTFKTVGPIGKATLPEGLPPAESAEHKCLWFFGSHGCDLPCHKTGNHRCLDEDGELCLEVDSEGYDDAGFRWTLYGGYEPWPTDPSWRESNEPCPKCGSPTTLVSDGDGTYTAHCCPASSCGCSRGDCRWSERRPVDGELTLLDGWPGADR